MSNSVTALQNELSQVIATHTCNSEDVLTSIPRLAFFRRSEVTEPCECVIQPSVVFTTQGRKQIAMGTNNYPYGAGQFLITSLDIPATSQVLDASENEPCLGLVYQLNIGLLAELITQHQLTPPKRSKAGESIEIGTLTLELAETFKRLVDLLDFPKDIEVLAPLIEREMHYRLLQSDLAPKLWQLASYGSPNRRVARAIDWLKQNYAQPFSIEQLAQHLQVSTSSLHHQFKQLTARSPLQYQKWLRLNEARRLMLEERFDAAKAAYQVGYESPSQFSREYTRQFGAPPKKDISKLQQVSA